MTLSSAIVTTLGLDSPYLTARIYCTYSFIWFRFLALNYVKIITVRSNAVYLRRKIFSVYFRLFEDFDLLFIDNIDI